ncbi:aminotransferase class V-fold PLP-dependent enzyme [Halioxenophilus aromaticivorans]|uniref:Aminotransferase class V-fold PLP-dependent enzyme n=1 Tax=Halioxenophilus aromaticivorans TaxID=1306992 RepID=A0AAV3U6V7_9ALTE
MPSFSRRSFLGTTLAAAAASSALPSTGAPLDCLQFNPAKSKIAPQSLAQDEAYWRYVGQFYETALGVINLEHGYWGKMAKPVEQHYQRLTHMVNQQLSLYARTQWNEDFNEVGAAVAEALAVKPSEIALTRNATESLHGIISQYKGLAKGDAVLYADIDYPAFQRAMQWLAETRGVEAIKLEIPAQATVSQLSQLYRQTLQNNPHIKLALLTHVSNQHGLLLPVKEIIEQAKRQGVDVICDCAQSWGLVDFTLPELKADWALFNLHKWIGSPVGVGALYMKEGTLDKVAPFPGESDPSNTDISSRVHMATSNFAAFLAVPAALEFHQNVGAQAKQERLRYLRKVWVDAIKDNPNIEILGAADSDTSTGMGGFRLAGKTSVADNEKLQATLHKQYNLFTVVRKDLASGANIRVTPQVFTPVEDVQALASALNDITK